MASRYERHFRQQLDDYLERTEHSEPVYESPAADEIKLAEAQAIDAGALERRPSSGP